MAFCICATALRLMSGLINVPEASGLPMGTWSICGAMSCLESFGKMDECAKTRRVEVQRCPAVPTAPKTMARTAKSKLALGATMIALLPPSSSKLRPRRRPTVSADDTAHAR